MQPTRMIIAGLAAAAGLALAVPATANPENTSAWYGATDEDRAADFERIANAAGFEDGDGKFYIQQLNGAPRIYQMIDLLRQAENPEAVLAAPVFDFMLEGPAAAYAGDAARAAYAELLELSLAGCSSDRFRPECAKRLVAYVEVLRQNGDESEIKQLLSDIALPDAATLAPQSKVWETLFELQNEMRTAGLMNERVEVLERLSAPTYAGQSEEDKAGADVLLANALLEADRPDAALKRLDAREPQNAFMKQQAELIRVLALVANGDARKADRAMEAVLASTQPSSSTAKAKLLVLGAKVDILNGRLADAEAKLNEACAQYFSPSQPCDTLEISDEYLVAWSDLYLAQGLSQKAEAPIAQRIERRTKIKPFPGIDRILLQQIDKIPGGLDSSVIEAAIAETQRDTKVAAFNTAYSDYRYREKHGQIDRRRRGGEKIEALLLSGFNRDWLGFSDYTVDSAWKKLAVTKFADGDSASALDYFERYLSGSPNYAPVCEAEPWYYRQSSIEAIARAPQIDGCRDAEQAKRVNDMFWLQIALHSGRDEQIAALARQRVIDALAVPDGTAAQFVSEDDKPFYVSLLDLAFPRADDPEQANQSAWVYQLMQIVMANETARNIAIGAAQAKAAERSPRAAELAEQFQRNFDRLNNVEEVKPGLFFPRSSLMDYAERDRLYESIRSGLEEEFPEYFDLIEVQPFSLEQTVEVLEGDEAVLHILPGRQGTMVAYADKDGVRFHRGKWSADEVRRAVQRLRWSMGADVGAPEGVEFRWADETPDATSLPFPTALAHDLYREILAPFEGRLRTKANVFVVADGAMASLPLHVLIARSHAGTDWEPGDLRGAEWVADEPYALVQLPSVQTLSILREREKREGPSGSGKPSFAGFGDPKLSGEPVSKSLPTLDKRSFDLARITRSGGPVRSVMQMAELPGTARELEAMRKGLGASEQSIRLGDFATEKAVHDADLSDIDVLHFATHGLLPGEMAGLLEAALVFTPVEDPEGRDNDALLRATEIAGMRLDADWVVLSACNTATTAGETGSYASFGGLPEAFFYAGADTLLASHWPVLDDVAERISVRTIELARSDANLSRGAALKRAMAEIRNDPEHPEWAHPSAWAPMVVIGLD